jgi:plastocyanin
MKEKIKMTSPKSASFVATVYDRRVDPVELNNIRRSQSAATTFGGSPKILLGLITAVTVLLLPVSLKADGAGTNSVEVKIDNFNFTPPALTVPGGTKVTWVNKDDVPHTVTSDNKLFGSRAMDTDDKFSFTFQTPGTYPYYCSVHPKMTGKVIVK